MARELVAALLALGASGCSLVLDFSDQAIPRDAAPDAPYSAEDCAYKEPNDTLQSAALVAPSDGGPAAICAGAPEDHDFFRFTVPASTSRVEIRVDSVYRPTGDLDLRLYDINRPLAIVESHSFSDEERITCPGSAPACPMLAPGDYVFEVLPAVPAAVNRYTFSLAITP